MSSKWHEKKKRLAEEQFERELRNSADDTTKNVITEVAMGGGDEIVFEKKLSKEEKKALAKAKREAKRKAKKGDDGTDDNDNEQQGKQKQQLDAEQLLQAVHEDGQLQQQGGLEDDGIDHAAADALAEAGTICTFSASRKGVDARSRDINVQNFTLQHMGTIMLEDTEIVLNHGNRYGLIGRNGAGTYHQCIRAINRTISRSCWLTFFRS